MTYKEFLNIVTFEEVAPHIVNMYPEAKDSLGWFKLHYDMLKQMTPKRHDDSNGDVCHITMKDWDDGIGPHLDAFPMEEICGSILSLKRLTLMLTYMSLMQKSSLVVGGIRPSMALPKDKRKSLPTLISSRKLRN